MTLKQVPVVLVDLIYCYKFIVAQLTDATGATKIVVRSNGRNQPDILANLRCELLGSLIKFDCLGGGMILIDHQKKEIKIGGESIDYGKEPNRAMTSKVIQDAYPDFNVKIR